MISILLNCRTYLHTHSNALWILLVSFCTLHFGPIDAIGHSSQNSRETGSLASLPAVYQEIPEHAHPRMCDWVQLQKFLTRGERKELRLLDEAIDSGGVLSDYRCRLRRFRLIGKHFWNRPSFGIVPIGCSSEEKDICIITYASFNKRYPDSVDGLKRQLEKIGFKGHFLYRIGGWPDLEGGSLTLAHVPYAFKPCFFREAKRLGYRLVLWLDSSIRPLKSLEGVFSAIEDRGYFWYSSGTRLARYCNRQAIEWFGYSAEDAREIESLAAGVIGLNLDHPKGSFILDEWMDAARAETGFYSARPEQNALSILAYRYGLDEWERSPSIAWNHELLHDETLFLVDYLSVQ
jgi:hypothetical protein